jgi:hypothetical protein
MKSKLAVMTLFLSIMSLQSAVAQANPAGPAAASNTPPAPMIRTHFGTVRGVTEGDVSSFKGIPFAAAPVGEYRWRPPQPLAGWQGEKDATKYGADCPQGAFGPGALQLCPRHHRRIASLSTCGNLRMPRRGPNCLSWYGSSAAVSCSGVVPHRAIRECRSPNKASC